MSSPKPRQSSQSPVFFLLALIFGLGVLLGVWRFYQAKQIKNEDLETSGFEVSSAPEYSEPSPPSAHENVIKRKDRLDYLIKEDRTTIVKQRSNPTPSAAHRLSPLETRKAKKIFKAVRFYYDLKNSERFKNSDFVREWKKDFFSYDDLRKVNAEYQKDRDALRFMVNMTKSPNFKELLSKHFKRPDSQDFLRSMTKSPEVQAAADTFTENIHIKNMVKHLDLANRLREEQIETAPESVDPPSTEDKKILKKKLEIKKTFLDIFK